MNKLHVGEHVQGQLVGAATSSRAGAYAITVSHPAAIRSSAYRGVVNFEVWADGHGYWSVYGFTRHITASGGLAPLYGPATAPMRATLTMRRLSKRDAAEPDSVLIAGCWVLASDLGQKLARLEGLWSTIYNVNKTLSYSVGSSSSISIGVEVNGGPWGSGSSGTTSVTNTVGGETYPPLADKTSKIGETEMEEGFFDTCQISTEYATFPYAVDGGTAWEASNPPTAKHCVPQLGDSTLNMDKTKSWTFSDGIDLSGEFGIDLAATTGYSSDANIKIHFAVAAFACGTAADPLRDTARGVVADDSNNGNS